jgi:GGDEF domain-containing protein
VARLGGDEFAVLLRGADTFKAAKVAQRISTLLEEPIDVVQRACVSGRVSAWPWRQNMP